MAEPFLSEIRMFSFAFPPKGWAVCSGQMLPIDQNQALYALIGGTFGGNGQTSFALPDLSARVPQHAGSRFPQGVQGGEEQHTLTMAEMPMHSHQTMASASGGNNPVPVNALLAGFENGYNESGNLLPIQDKTIGNTGGGNPHNNMQPYLTINFCIALAGVFPPRD